MHLPRVETSGTSCSTDTSRRLKPHPVNTFKVSRNKNFAAQLEDVVALSAAGVPAFRKRDQRPDRLVVVCDLCRRFVGGQVAQLGGRQLVLGQHEIISWRRCNGSTHGIQQSIELKVTHATPPRSGAHRIKCALLPDCADRSNCIEPPVQARMVSGVLRSLINASPPKCERNHIC